MRTYYFLSQLLSPGVRAAFVIYSSVLRLSRCRVLASNARGDILLIQAWPDTRRWSLPGGGIKRGEEPELTAVRELREETGLDASADTMVFLLSLKLSGHQELVYRTVLRSDVLPLRPPKRLEVRRSKWFSRDRLPELTPDTRRILGKVVQTP